MGKIVNDHRAPAPLVNFARSKTYDAGASDYTATSLIEEPRIVALSRKHGADTISDPYDNPWSYISTAMHHMVSLAASEDQIPEERIFTEYGGKIISGAMDLQTVSIGKDFSREVVIGDYKLSTVYGIRNTRKFEAQLNIYAWLVERENPGTKVTGLEVYAFLRDWKISMSETRRDYPARPGVTIDIPLWDYPAREEYVRERMEMHEAAKKSIPDCSHAGRWPIGERWKIVKPPSERAVNGHAKYYSQRDADVGLNDMDDPSKYEIVHIMEGYRRCQSYCDVSPWCDQWAEYKKTKEEK